MPPGDGGWWKIRRVPAMPVHRVDERARTALDFLPLASSLRRTRRDESCTKSTDSGRGEITRCRLGWRSSAEWQTRPERGQRPPAYPVDQDHTDQTPRVLRDSGSANLKLVSEPRKTVATWRWETRRKLLTKGTTFALFVAQKVSPKVSPTPEMTQGRERCLVLSYFATLSCVESG
jgi:hypothetical protein